MESVLIEIDDMVSELRELVDSLTIYIENKPVSKQVRDGVYSFLQHLNEYSKVSQEDDIDKLTSSAKAVAIYGDLPPALKDTKVKLTRCPMPKYTQPGKTWQYSNDLT